MSRIFLLFVLFALLNSIEARHKSHHSKCKHKDHTNKIFRRFYEDVIEVDKKEEHYCKKLNDVILKEYYGIDIYKLIVPMKNATEEDLKIKIHHRALLVDIEDKFTVIRTLPEIVNPKISSYIIEDGNVLISFSYNVVFGKEVEVKCDNEIEDKSSFVSKESETVKGNPKEDEIELFEVTTN